VTLIFLPAEIWEIRWHVLLRTRIAIEAKKSSRPDEEKVDDKKRLRAMTKPVTEVFGWDGVHPEHVCGYAVGVFVEIDIEKRLIRLDYFKKGERTKRREEKF
jgi:hypothetical protein